jgi:hypothetical protein
MAPTTEIEKRIADEKRCIWQTSYGTITRPRGKEIQDAHATYCGRKAVNANLCRKHYRQLGEEIRAARATGRDIPNGVRP